MNRLHKTFLQVAVCIGATQPVFTQNNWTAVYTPTDEQEHYYGIYAIDPQRVILSSEWGRVYRSDDGCQSVELHQVPNNFSIFGDIDFQTDQVGYIGGGCWFPFGDCIPSAILSTTDGGITWTPKQVSSQLGIIMNVQALSDGHVFALGDYSGVFHLNESTGEWDSLGTPSAGAGYHRGMHFLNASTGYLTHYNGSRDRLFKTENGGLSWSLVNDSLPDIFIAPYFFSAEKAVLPGIGGKLFHTENGGITWSILAEFGDNQALTSLQFIDDSTGFITTYHQPTLASRIWRTSNGGKNWVSELLVEGRYLNQLHMIDSANGYAFDDHHTIYRRSGTSATQNPGNAPTISIYPNPASDLITVTQFAENAVFVLFDLTGRRVCENQIGPGTTTINCQHLPPGLYTYHIGGATGKLVMQR